MTLRSMIGSMLLASVAACAAASGAADLGMKPALAGSRTSAPPKGEIAAGSICAATEVVLFSCETQTDKQASLCASKDVGTDRGYVYYTYGSPAKPELVFPAGKRPPRDFRRTQLGFAGSTGGYAYSFENAGYRYVVYSISGEEGLEDQGVLVTTRDDPRTAITSLSCRKGSVVEDDGSGLLDLTLGWPGDPDLERHGLPKRN